MIVDLVPLMKNKLQPNELSNDTKKSMNTRIITALIAIAVVLPCIFLGDFFILGLMLPACFLACYEIINMIRPKANLLYSFIAFIFVVTFVLFPFILCAISGEPLDSGHIFTYFLSPYAPLSVSFVGAFILVMFAIFKEDFSFKDAAVMFFSFFIIAVGIQACLYLRYFPSALSYYSDPSLTYWNTTYNLENSTLMIFVIASALLNDAGAYFVGVLFGKHRLNERISPKKSWEGFFGGIIIGGILGFLLGFILALVDHPILPGILDLDHWYLILILALVIPFVAVIGDLAFSAIKRTYNIKDFGYILPGHGGVLDRIDSVVFTAAISAIFINIFAICTNCPITFGSLL